MILEYIEGGELFDYICEKGRLPADEALDYLQQLIGAITYCHRFNIAHRDLKPENLLLDTNRQLKVADFGMAAWQGGGTSLLETACGSPHYAAPEVVRGEPYEGSSADIWSCGVILYALLAGRLPFDDEDILKLLEKVKLAKFAMPSDIEPGAKDLISRMLEKDIKKRIKMPEILAHPWYISRPQSSPSVVPQPPTLESLALPVARSASEIDPDIFGNLRTLWTGATDEEITSGLVGEERNWEKTVYRLLMEYRRKCVEEWDLEEEARREREARREQKRRIAQIEREVSGKGKETQTQLSRPDPATPRRAATQRRSVTSSNPAGRARSKTVSAPSGPPPLPAPPEINPLRPVRLLPSPDIHAIRTVSNAGDLSPFPTPSFLSPNSLVSPMTTSTGTPMPTPATPLWDALSSLALPPVAIDADAPELQDENVQRFFRQIVERMNGMQGDGTPNINELLSPVLGGVGADALGLGINVGGSITTPVKSTAPLKFSPKASKDKGKDKENGAKGVVRSIFRRPSTNPPSTECGRPALAERRVQILLPPKIERGKQEKIVEGENEDSSSAAHSTSAGTSSGTSSSSSSAHSPSAHGRRSWFANLFKPRSHLTHTLTSSYTILTSSSALDSAELILIGLGAKVGLVEVEGIEMLKCEMEEKKDPAGIMETVRAVAFRVEIRLTVKADEGEKQEGEKTGGVDVVLTYERGSLAAFRLACKRVEREWRMGEPKAGDQGRKGDLADNAIPPDTRVPSPVVGEGGRFVEGIGASVVCGY